jgi:NADPH:quinone reductase-like Zn-dependent oxidoreductase
MKAIVRHTYGSPDVLELAEVAKPTPRDDEVLIKVQAASVNAADWRMLRADPFLARLDVGLITPRNKILGFDVAGTVEAAGRAVKQFQVGDEVFGNLFDLRGGAFAEYVAAPERLLVRKPANLTFLQAAAVPMAAVTALRGLRAGGPLKPGQKVLIYGASGGVGTFAVQIAKALGAEVTAVVSPRNRDQARSLGADHVIDYTRWPGAKRAMTSFWRSMATSRLRPISAPCGPGEPTQWPGAQGPSWSRSCSWAPGCRNRAAAS